MKKELFKSKVFSSLQANEIEGLEKITGGDCDTSVYSNGTLTGHDKNVDGSTGNGSDDDVQQECDDNLASRDTYTE